jgi:hypothetical protein
VPEPDQIAEIVVMCPCCGHAVYGELARTEWACAACEQTWTMKVDLGRIARFSVM